MADSTVEQVTVVEQPIGSRRRLRMVCIGAGFAGVFLAHRHRYGGDSSFVDLVIYEKNSGIGGTWYENVYPGIACDVPAHIYCFPFAPNPGWSRFYVSGPEILEYMNGVVDKFGLRRYIQCGSKVISVIWSQEKGKWDVKIQHDNQIIDEEADILVNGSGILNQWRWPDIPGLQSFRGTLVHSAAWNTNLDWKGKKVGIIGNGSSAIQILPQMQPEAASITTYIRTATLIIPNFLAEFTPDGKNFEYTEEQKQTWRDNPELLRDHRRELEHVFNNYFQVFLNDSPQQSAVRNIFGNIMRQKLGNDESLIDKLMPDWPVGCRRITPGDGYLEALQEENVKIITDPIVEVSEKGIVTSPRADTGTEKELHELDIIVCATGFDVSFRPAFEVRGLNGASLSKLWENEAEGYLGIWAPECPNYFIYNGPNCPIGHGSLMACMDVATEYILRWADKIAKQNIKSVVVKPDVVREYNDYSQAFLKRTVWAANCHSWYKGHRADGPVSTMYAGSTIHYREMLREFRIEDFDYTYGDAKNRFTFMGNVITQLEAEGGNLGFYLDM